MARRDEFRLWLSVDQCLLKCHARISVENGIGASDQTVAFLENTWHSRDLEPACFSFRDAAAHHRECFAEERADEMRLEAPGLRPLHLLADRTDRVRVHPLRSQLALCYQLFDRLYIDRAIDLSEQFSFGLWEIAVAVRFHEEV